MYSERFDEIVPIDLALMVWSLCPYFHRAYEIVPIGLALIVIGASVPVDIEAYEIVPMFGIDSLRVVAGLIRV